jgi:hypothetical protein
MMVRREGAMSMESGPVAPSGLEAHAGLEALRLASVQPEHARQLAIGAERAARGARDWAAESIAKRARGVAAMQLR